MKYSQIRRFDIANGPGIRTSIFISGCTHNCPGCFNPEYFDFDYGEDWTEETTEKVLGLLSADEVTGLTVLGGEPFQSARELAPVLKELRKKSGKSIWIYSGYTLEQILDNSYRKELLEKADVLVDGLFEEDKKDPSLQFRGSFNQRIIDVKKSLEKGQAVLWESE